MLKLLFWGIVGYIIYRYFQLKAQLKEGQQNHSRQQPFHQQHHEENGKSDEGEYIDYEELK